MMSMKKLVLGVLLAAALAGCAGPVLQAKIYNLKTGQQFPAVYTYNGTGKGKMTFMLPDGRRAEGEYLTLADMSSVAWGSIYGLSGATAANSTQRGSAIAADGKGFIIQCEYTTDLFSGGGMGSCQDNEGTPYRFSF